MTAMFPDSGVPHTDAKNSLPNPIVEANCDKLWYSTARCEPRFDPAAANAVLSELINLINGCGTVYDCSKLTNLHTAVMQCIYNALFGCLPHNFPSADGCTLQNIVLSIDSAGCQKIAVYDNVFAFMGYVQI